MTMIVNSMSVFAVVGILIGVAQAARAQAADEEGARVQWLLEGAGYKANEPTSLVTALHDADIRVAAAAAVRLGFMPGSAIVVEALKGTIEQSPEGVMLAAVGSLQRLAAKGWEEGAIRRLENMDDPVVRLLLAQVLAMAGRSNGWPFVQEPMSRDVIPNTRGLAIRVSVAFDGLIDAEGRPIDVERELAMVRDISSSIASEVARATARVREARESAAGQEKARP